MSAVPVLITEQLNAQTDAPNWTRDSAAVIADLKTLKTSVNTDDSNLVHITGAETITGQKTFPAQGATAVIIPAIIAGNNNTGGHIIPNVADDTFTLNAATQTLASVRR